MARFLEKYVTGDSLQWLLDPADRDVRYLALRDLLDEADGDDYRRLEGFLASGPLLKNKNGIPGSQGRYDLLYSGSLWILAEAVERGLDRRSEVIEKIIRYLREAGTGEAGGFSLPWKPRAESALYTGEMVRLSLAAGFSDDAVAGSIRWILEHQRHDGGWLQWQVGGWADLASFLFFNRPGKGGLRDSDRSVTSCPYASIACARALLLNQKVHPSPEAGRAIAAAAEFFLKRKFFDFRDLGFFNSRLISRQDFRLLGFPVFGQYDILTGLIFISLAGRFNDPRASEAFNLVMSKQNGNGSWDQESAEAGMLFGNKRKRCLGRESKWVTLNVLRMLKYAEETEQGQLEKA
ncbi:MAG TPA: hypothetical protein PK926_09350 [Spirochaetota bacterium]|nr:hypothetical protein [Spirochaetota bacterium]HPI89786.1 hypothetical protein [Spirochaetota bacterium]HPR47573.1 hypothetical protein [Spirochaetota bacterium]